MNPKEVLQEIDLKRDMVAAEFGCGSGIFALLLAKRLRDGLVYAIDIQEAPLSFLKSRSQIEKISNIRIIRSDLEKPRGSTLPDVSVDLVLIPNVLFQAKKRDDILKETARVLKKGGTLVVIDWLPKASQGPEKGRISQSDVKELAKDAGLKFKKEFKAGSFHFGLVFEKP